MAGSSRWIATKIQSMALAIALVPVMLLSPQDALAETSLDQALAASAGDLAQGYLWVKFINEFALPAAEKGITIQLGSDETIDSKNINEYRLKYQERLSAYRQAIQQRGYQTIAGTYGGTMTQSCARTQSAWVDLLREGRNAGIEITQNSYDLKVVVSGKYRGKKLVLSNPGAIVESGIAFQDEMNTEYFFRATVQDRRIEIRPSPAVLRLWPQWANPPLAKDLEDCVITLDPL